MIRDKRWIVQTIYGWSVSVVDTQSSFSEASLFFGDLFVNIFWNGSKQVARQTEN